MKILTLWLWAFGFAINKVLWENNPNKIFYSSELNKQVVEKIRKTREHPFFFKWYTLPENIEIIDNVDDILWEVDLIIIAIPAQFISWAISWLKWKLKAWVTILNLAKWIDIKSNKTISKLISEQLWGFDYNYWVLSWWMIASEVVEWKVLWADLWIKNSEIWSKIKKLLENENFKIKLREDVINIELYGSLKNIAAIIVGYYEWLWNEASTVGFKLLEFYEEMKELIWLYGWNKNIDFSYYSLWWDMVATCFGNSRNRYFWKLLWSWLSINEVLNKLEEEKKHAEWYETLKAVYNMIKHDNWYDNVKFLYNLVK